MPSLALLSRVVLVPSLSVTPSIVVIVVDAHRKIYSHTDKLAHTESFLIGAWDRSSENAVIVRKLLHHSGIKNHLQSRRSFANKQKRENNHDEGALILSIVVVVVVVVSTFPKYSRPLLPCLFHCLFDIPHLEARHPCV